MWKKSLFISLIVVLLFGATGCIKIKKDTVQTGNLGGIFLSADRMETWKHSSLLMTPGETPGSIGGVNSYFMKIDPSDSNALYVGTRENGLYYSYNGGAGWTLSKGLGAESFVRDLAIDPKNKCRLYALVGTKVYVSADCARTWKETFYTDSSAKYTSVVAVDWFDPKVVWVGLSDGSLHKSEDFGKSWRPIKKFPKRVRRISIDSFDSRQVYVGISGVGVYKTADKGDSWTTLTDGMKDFKGAKSYYSYAISSGSKDLVLYASKFGLLRSLDGGSTWSEIDILSNPGEELIYSVVIDPSNANNIYYSTDKALYKSLDGGTNWIVKKMPTTRVARQLLIHPKDGTKIYMAALAVLSN